jgi:poly(hydroxyalkanoate) depolymerase family esterase
MWRRLVAFMRVDGVTPGRLKPQPRPAPAMPLPETAFRGPNPGNLRMFSYLPARLKGGAPLVVVLHGCAQTAAGYASGAGWLQLADKLGFAVLAPEQKALNNPNTCFDWFNPEDVTRGQGEAASIAGMIGQMLESHGLDPARVFISGLSAGGAMAAAMLATYPEIFAGGAIVAGLPYGAAGNVRDALEAMRSAPLRTPRQWGDVVRGASDYQGLWPRVSIWHGALDTTVNVNNAQASVAQWADLQGLSLVTDARQDVVDGAVRLRWGDRLEVYTMPALGHGVPIDSRDAGVAAPFILEAGISSTSRIAQFWGLEPVAKPAAKPAVKPMPAPIHVVPTPKPAVAEPMGPIVTAEGLLRRLWRKLPH